MIEEALDHAERIVTESGAGEVTIAEIARQIGIRPPSLYKYFASLHAVYDGLFARGNTRMTEYVDAATEHLDPGLDRMLEIARAMTRWSMLNPGLATLLFWRPVPGFEPSPESYALAERMVERARHDLAVAARGGELAPEADSDEVFRIYTSLSAGLCSQQFANQPGATYESGLFTSLTDRVLDMFVAHHAAPRPRKAPP